MTTHSHDTSSLGIALDASSHPPSGGVHAGTSFEFSPSVVDHFNAVAARAPGVLADEYKPFTSGEHFSIACTWSKTPKATFIDEYKQLRAVIDGQHEIRLADHPRLFSYAADPNLIRGVPTFIPKTVMPDDFFGQIHTLELYHDRTRIFGPDERLFHTATSGALFSHIEDGPGKLVIEVRGRLDVLARRGVAILFTDPVFGEADGALQVEPDGMVIPLECALHGRDLIGDLPIFYEWIVRGIAPRGPTLTLEVPFLKSGRGLAAALHGGHTRDLAFRVDAGVL